MGVIEKSGLNLANKFFPHPHPLNAKKQETTKLDTDSRCYVWHPSHASLLVSQGLVLVGSINGGQASNLCTLIAGGDVALSVAWSNFVVVVELLFKNLRAEKKAESMMCSLPYRVGYTPKV